MREDTSIQPSDKSPHERFKELGEKLMRVPHGEVKTLEKRWKAGRARKKHKPKK